MNFSLCANMSVGQTVTYVCQQCVLPYLSDHNQYAYQGLEGMPALSYWCLMPTYIECHVSLVFLV